MRVVKSVLLAALLLSGALACHPQAPPPPPPLAILTPSRDGMLTAAEPITITFNLPLPDQLDLALQPEAAYTISRSADSSVLTISPLEAWAYDTEYSLEVQGLQYEFSVGPEPSVSVFAGGDILLDKRPGEQIQEHGPDVVFHGLREVLDAADIRFANLENPLSLRGAPVQKNFRFRSPPATVNALSAAGFDVLAFTNNHTFDFGEEAFLDTLEHLEEAGIEYLGVGRDRARALAPVVIERDGISVAFLAFMQRTILPAWSPPLWEAGVNKPGVIFLDGEQGKETILAAVREAQLVADVVLVSLHWGVEGTRAPQEWQRSLAKSIISAGADAVLGHHPHLPFGVETHMGKPIIYSMGNLLFHPYDPEARESFVATFSLNRDGVVKATLHPILMHDGTTALLRGNAADNVLQLITDRSAALGTQLTRSGDTLIVRLTDD